MAENICFSYNWPKMLSSSLYAMIKLSKKSSPQKLFDYDCVTLYVLYSVYKVEYRGAAALKNIYVYYKIKLNIYLIKFILDFCYRFPYVGCGYQSHHIANIYQ